ncbi:MAG: murein biosynthesis integral membrane protein MurJ [Actinomycetota bacterium]
MTSLRRATAVMTVGTVFSRITGVLRVAAVLGALGVVSQGRLADTYNIGNTAPNIIYELVLGGVITSVFVPVFVELLETEGRDRAWEVASAIINLSIVVLTAMTIIGIVAAPLIAKFYASSLHGSAAVEQQRVLAFLLRLFIPQIIFYGLYSVTAGLLNAHRRFGAPMYTPALGNVAVIVVFVAFYFSYGAVGGLGEISNWQLVVIGGGTTLGILLQALTQLPFLKGLGRYRLTLSIRHPAIRKLGRLAVFVIGYVVVNQIGYLIVQKLADAQLGGYTAYTAAFTFYMLPHGLFAVSVVTALLPDMSAHAMNQRWDLYRDRISVGMRTTLLLILPAAIGYFVLATPIIRLLLEHGVMRGSDVALVARVLRYFVLGLVSFSLFQLFLRAFYALQDTKTPFWINCWWLVVNTAVNFPLFFWFRSRGGGVEGLALGHAVAYTVATVFLWRALAKRAGGIPAARFFASAVRILAAAAGMGAAVWGTYAGIGHVLGPGSTTDLLEVAVPVLVGVVSYVGLALAFSVEELGFVKGIVRRGT